MSWLGAGSRERGAAGPKLQAPSSKLYAPRPVRVRLSGSTPTAVDGKQVESIREEWLVEDRWWTSEPLRRHYLELVLVGGRCTVVYRDLETGAWSEQR